MTSTDHALSELLTHAARRIRNDARLEIQPAMADAPARPVDVHPIADLLALAARHVGNYERPGWDEKKIRARLSDMDIAALALARSIVDPSSPPS